MACNIITLDFREKCVDLEFSRSRVSVGRGSSMVVVVVVLYIGTGLLQSIQRLLYSFSVV